MGLVSYSISLQLTDDCKPTALSKKDLRELMQSLQRNTSDIKVKNIKIIKDLTQCPKQPLT